MRVVIQNENRSDLDILLGDAYIRAAKKAQSYSYIKSKYELYSNSDVIIYETNTTYTAKYLIYDCKNDITYPLHSIKWLDINTANVEVTEDAIKLQAVVYWPGNRHLTSPNEYRKYEIVIDRKYSTIKYYDQGRSATFKDYI